MGLFDIFRRNVRDTSASSEAENTPAQADSPSDVLLRAFLNGDPITREMALTLPVISGAVDFICNCVACMPVKLYRIKKGIVEEVTKDIRPLLLNGDTGDTLDGFQLKKAVVEDYLLGKGGYIYIKKRLNDVEGLFYVEDKEISVIRGVDPIFKDYQISVAGKLYEPFDFVKVLRNTKDGASGIGLVEEVKTAIETAYQTLVYQLCLVKSGGNKKGFLKSQKRLEQKAIDTLKEAWKRMYANNEENVIVLNQGLEFQEASSTSVEMQLNESKKTLQAEIDNVFHIKPDFEETFKCAIFPILRAFETALDRDLLLEEEKGKFFYAFDTTEIIKASLQERYAAYKTAKDTGFMTINEIRQKENMNAIDGMDVINVGLSAVLYDTKKGTYFTPNTGETSDANQKPGQKDKTEDQPDKPDDKNSETEADQPLPVPVEENTEQGGE